MTPIDQRLTELREELATGERALAELDQRREHLVTSMLRISGAVQVLEELAAPDTDLGTLSPVPDPVAAGQQA
jgi:hypothetical protein